MCRDAVGRDVFQPKGKRGSFRSMQLGGTAHARVRCKYHDWLGRMSGSRAGGSGLSEEARDEKQLKQRGLVGEVEQ